MILEKIGYNSDTSFTKYASQAFPQLQADLDNHDNNLVWYAKTPGAILLSWINFNICMDK